MSESLRHQAVKGVVWSAVERFSVQGVQFILGIIIARLVSPSEYGLIAMLGIFLAVAQTFIDSGFSSALIQKKERTEADFSTVFYFNIVVSFAVYLLLFFASPFIAEFYQEPILELLTKWISLSIVISAFSIVQRAKLTIQLNFKMQAKASFIAVVISGIVGIFLAWNKYGVWALVIQVLLNNFFNTMFLWLFSPWKLQLLFSKYSLCKLFGFSSKILLAEMLNTAYTNMYSLVIGKVFSSIALGYYARSLSFSNFLSINLTSIVQRVFYPMLCEAQNEEERMKSLFLKSLRSAFFIICPCIIGLAALAKPLVSLLLTDKWIIVAYLLPILCFANLFYPLQCISVQAIYAKGDSNYILKAEAVKKTLGIVILIMTLPYGLYVLCSGIILYNILDLMIIQFFLSKSIGISGIDIIKKIYPIFFCGLVMGGIIYITTLIISSSFLSLLIGVIIGSISYFSLSLFFNIEELNFIKSKFL